MGSLKFFNLLIINGCERFHGSASYLDDTNEGTVNEREIFPDCQTTKQGSSMRL